MSNMAVGIPIGLAAGIGVGIASGKRQAQEEIVKKMREFAATHQMKIQNPSGQALSVDEFILDIVGETQPATKNKTIIVSVTIGILILLLGVGAFLFFFLNR